MFIDDFYLALGGVSGLLLATLLLYHCKRKTRLASLEKNNLLQLFDEISQILSHEMSNPLTAILGSVELISRFKTDNNSLARIERSLSQIKCSVERMDTLRSDLMILITIESNRIELKQEETLLQELIAEIIEYLKPLVFTKNLQIGHKIHPTCPETIFCDREKLSQVLRKLMDNSIKFTNQGGIFLEVEAKNKQLQFQVCDTGVGIPTEHLTKIFDRFWQAKEFAYQGKGLGLTIAKGIVEAHKGKIWVESTYGQGSSIYFTLPV